MNRRLEKASATMAYTIGSALNGGWNRRRGTSCGRRTAAFLPPRGIVESGDSGRFMAETADDLSTPLGQETVRPKRRFRLPFTGLQALAVALGLFLVAFAGFALFNDNPLGGEPTARIVLRQPNPAEKSAAAQSGPMAPEPKSVANQATSSDQKTITVIDGSSGKRQDFIIS